MSRRASLNRSIAFIHMEAPMESESSRLVIGLARLLRFFPALVLAFLLFSAGLSVRELFFKAANQLITVDGTRTGAGK